MGNVIWMPQEQEELVESLSMSNGLTSVFMDVLVLSGSALADSAREKELIIWLAQQDQSIVGIGTVGFGIEDMPWTVEHFEQERAFMNKTIQGAIHGLGWERLSYEPRKDWVIRCLEHFRVMINTFSRSYINEANYLEWAEVEEG